jgi:hypothetical protein
LTDHLLKILVGKPLPRWVFSLAKIGDGFAHGAHFVHDATLDGLHIMVKGFGSVASGIGGLFHGHKEVRQKPQVI